MYQYVSSSLKFSHLVGFLQVTEMPLFCWNVPKLMINLTIKIHFEKNITTYNQARVFQYPAVSYLVSSNDVMQRGFTNVCSGPLCFNTRIPRFSQSVPKHFACLSFTPIFWVAWKILTFLFSQKAVCYLQSHTPFISLTRSRMCGYSSPNNCGQPDPKSWLTHAQISSRPAATLPVHSFLTSSVSLLFPVAQSYQKVLKFRIWGYQDG